MPSGTIPISRAARATRTAISPRLAISSRLITECGRTALEKGVQALLTLGTDALLGDRLRRDRARVVVRGLQHAPNERLCRADRIRADGVEFGRPPPDRGIELR